MLIRAATNLDLDAIQSVHHAAFAVDERALIATLAANLLMEHVTPAIISLVVEIEARIVAHVAFSPVTLAGNPAFQGYILAPLAVKPAYQKRRLGAQLIEHGIRQLSQTGVHRLFVYGDPKYYSQFGFTAEAAEMFIPPYPLQYPFGWQAVVLNDRLEKPSGKIAGVASLCDPALW